jgi:hypothetical protein
MSFVRQVKNSMSFSCVHRNIKESVAIRMKIKKISSKSPNYCQVYSNHFYTQYNYFIGYYVLYDEYNLLDSNTMQFAPNVTELLLHYTAIQSRRLYISVLPLIARDSLLFVILYVLVTIQ